MENKQNLNQNEKNENKINRNGRAPDALEKDVSAQTSRPSRTFATTAVGIAAACIIVIIAICNIVLPDKEFSEKENRVLATFPHFSLTALKEGTFASEAETYVTDQFMARDMWIALRSKIELALGKYNSNGVYKGADGYLFEDTTVPAEGSITEKASAITDFANRYQDIPMAVLVAPNSANVLADKLPAYAPLRDQNVDMDALFAALRGEDAASGADGADTDTNGTSNIAICPSDLDIASLDTSGAAGDLDATGSTASASASAGTTTDSTGSTAAANITVLDIRDAFAARKDSLQLFYRTDHHWTTDGAYIAFLESGDALGINPAKYGITKYLLADDFCGTLASKSGFPVKEPDQIKTFIPYSDTVYVVEYVEEGKKESSIYEPDCLEKNDQYTVFFGGNFPQVDIRSSSENRENLLVIKDSYANAYVPFLIPHFSSITMIDPRYYNGDIDALMDEKDIDRVLFLYNANTFFADTSLASVLGYQAGNAS